jgi:hypothetical protein
LPAAASKLTSSTARMAPQERLTCSRQIADTYETARRLLLT